MLGTPLMLVFSFIVGLLAGCGGAAEPQALSKKPNDAGPPAGYSLDEHFQDVYEFAQGYASRYDLYSTAQVPAPGKAVVTVEHLPAGAVFDGKVLSWTPPCNEPDAGFYTGGIGEAYVVVTLRSSLDDTQFIQRSPVLLVHQFDSMPGHVCGDPVWQPGSRKGP